MNARTFTGWHIYSALFAALSGLARDMVMAGPGLLVFTRVVGTYPDGKGYNAPIFTGGGQGGSQGRDGIGGFIFPSSASNVSIEVFETACPAMITEKEWIADTAGAGQFRGGPAERTVVRRLPGYVPPVRMRYAPIRGTVPGPGMFGGHDGTLDIPLWNGELVSPDSEIARDGWVMFRTDADVLTFHAPSGAGFGDPRQRDRAAIEADIRSQLVTRDGARRDYAY